MKLKWKILIPLILLTLLFITKWIYFNYPISEGKKTGVLKSLVQKSKYGVLNSWEGELAGDPSFIFSIHNKKLAEDLFSKQGREVTLSYEEYKMAFPYETNFNIVSFESGEAASTREETKLVQDETALDVLNRTLFCSLLGSLYHNQRLYLEVKEYLKVNNLYLYKQIEKCNR